MIAAIDARKGTEQNGVAGEGNSVTRLRPVIGWTSRAVREPAGAPHSVRLVDCARNPTAAVARLGQPRREHTCLTRLSPPPRPARR